MAASVFIVNFICRPRPSDSLRGRLFFAPTILAFLTSLFIFYYISSTSRLLVPLHSYRLHRLHHVKPPVNDSPNKPIVRISLPKPSAVHEYQIFNLSRPEIREAPPLVNPSQAFPNDQSSKPVPILGSFGNHGNYEGEEENEVFHDRAVFLENYMAMNRSFKIYVYPHRQDDPFANVLLPVAGEPGGNYASESYFKKSLFKSHFITKDPSKADFFFLPFSIASMRNDKRIGVGGIQNFVRDYMHNITHHYPYWNRSGGADHFYVACHSIGKVAMDKAAQVNANAVQVVCSSNYFVYGYVPHKDVSLPQIWPRQGDYPQLVQASQRKRLAFFAGAINCPVRKELVQVWRNDEEIFAHSGRLKTPYSTELLRSKFCLHVKGFEVNTARIGDALYYGCVPVVLADHYDLPFADILNWKSFSVVVATADIPRLKEILQGIGPEEYSRLQSNVLKARTHFQWHASPSPVEFDAFHMVIYELWLRRSYVRVPTF
ncbi:probable glycosyltransferase At5g03795 [Diospyros lotus]|uniref:probable glycosyltransferase At5g03795 n=1 Tax=Diospyros lotus TaxID=55363 RepID=UPI0022540EE1|nr:probable glycosyltransferase At5g03795 [Diospyros lotus]